MSQWTAYEDLYLARNWKKSTHAVMGVAIGRTINAVRNRCSHLGLIDKTSEWSESEVAALKELYAGATHNEQLDLQGLADTLGRHKTNVCRKARELGLTNQRRKDKAVTKPTRRYATEEELRAAMSANSKAWIAENGHPRGALGMKHTAETKAVIAEKSRLAAARTTEEQYTARALKSAKTRDANGTVNERPNASWKAAWREIGGVRKYYRSKWEANYAYYLQWMKAGGHIQDWKHEPKTFWFEGVKRGVVSYKPDFWVQENTGAEAYHEVKGWMDHRSATTIKRMAKYHPQVKLIVIDSKAYEALRKSVSSLVPGWEV